jgi:hypothetical protein
MAHRMPKSPRPSEPIPTRSRWCLVLRPLSLSTRKARVTPKAPMGTLIQKIQRQER